MPPPISSGGIINSFNYCIAKTLTLILRYSDIIVVKLVLLNENLLAEIYMLKNLPRAINI